MEGIGCGRTGAGIERISCRNSGAGTLLFTNSILRSAHAPRFSSLSTFANTLAFFSANRFALNAAVRFASIR
jgi:hypothetical protein